MSTFACVGGLFAGTVASCDWRSGDCSAVDDPLCRLAGDKRDVVVVAIVVQDGGAFSFGYRCYEQVGKAD
jgi:hypothetical protein